MSGVEGRSDGTGSDKPLECFRLILCQHSITADTGMLSFINAVSRVDIPLAATGKATTPGMLEVALGLRGEGHYHACLFWRDAEGATHRATDPVSVGVSGDKTVKIGQIYLPPGAGAFDLTLEWCAKVNDFGHARPVYESGPEPPGPWQRAGAFAPVEVHVVEPPKPAAQA